MGEGTSSKRDNKSDFSSLSDVLGGMKLPRTVREHVRNHQLWSKWSDVVGAELAKVTYPAELRGRTLEVKVVHQAWAQQLQFLKPSILGKLRAICPNTQINDLLFRVGKVSPTPSGSSSTDNRLKNLEPVELPERLEMTLRAIEDDQLRASIRKAMEAEARSKVQRLGNS